MKDFSVNKEAWHESWLRGYVEVGRRYLEREYGAGASRALILKLDSDDPFRGGATYDLIGVLSMPRGGGSLCAKMAPYTVARELIIPGEVKGESVDFPPETFFLQALLEAAYPYKPDGSGFRAHAELMIGCDLDELIEMGGRVAELTAFFGYGVLLMNGLRQLMDPLAGAEDVISRTCESYLCVMENERPTTPASPG